jgi:hypothetical protein
MGIQDDNPRVKQIRSLLVSRLDAVQENIRTDRKLDALTSLAWVRTHLDELLCNLGCSPLSVEESEDG